MATKGLKICRETADAIRGQVAVQISRKGYVRADFVEECLKREARDDAHWHAVYDPNFQHGDGPAVER